MPQKPRDTCKYHLKVGGRIVHSGITKSLDRREREHQEKWLGGRIEKVGRRTTEEAAREWEKKQKHS